MQIGDQTALCYLGNAHNCLEHKTRWSYFFINYLSKNLVSSKLAKILGL